MIHIPYIEALDDLGLRPSIISGCSIGALIGAGWASGMTGRELREFSIEVLGTMKVIAGRIWATHVGRGITDIFRNGVPVQLDARKTVESFTPQPFPQTFKELKVPFYVVATDYQSWHQVVFNEGPLIPAIAGSIAIPTVFKPVIHANHVLVDGGVVNPLPLDQVATDSDITIGIDVNGDPSESLARTDHRPIDMWFGSAQIMMHSLIAHMMAAYPPRHIHSTPYRQVRSDGVLACSRDHGARGGGARALQANGERQGRAVHRSAAKNDRISSPARASFSPEMTSGAWWQVGWANSLTPLSTAPAFWSGAA